MKIKIMDIYRIKKIKTHEIKYKDVIVTEKQLRVWVKFLRWLFQDEWEREKQRFDSFASDDLRQHRDKFTKYILSQREHAMHTKLVELGYQLKSQFDFNLELDDNEEPTVQLIDHHKPLFIVVKNKQNSKSKE